ncbi:hypothetical protein ACMFMF_002534 [Clarireedia jacksonii]
MPLNANSPKTLHFLQNIILISICATFIPLLTFITIFSQLIAPFTSRTQHLSRHRKWRTHSSPTFRPRTILVTGVGMSKGLSLARTFHRAGHTVIGADFEPYYIPVSGHFSTALKTFYRLTQPSSSDSKSSKRYIHDILSLIKAEGVELWISCSGVASAIEDGLAAERIEKEAPACKIVQFGARLTEVLHEKSSFIEHTQGISLNVPITHRVTSANQAIALLHPSKGLKVDKAFIMKPEGMDDSARADMTLLPLSSLQQTEKHVQRLAPSETRPFVFQQFIPGIEYCTHASIINGTVHSFVACRSSDMLMHYVPLAFSSALAQAMLRYTELYAARTRAAYPMTGHLSLDFLVEEKVAVNAESAFGVQESKIESLMKELYPIECNPRVHTAVVLLAECAEDLADSYTSLLSSSSSSPTLPTADSTSAGAIIPTSTSTSTSTQPIHPPPRTPPHYWIGHDLITLVFHPLLHFLLLQTSPESVLTSWFTFLAHVLSWKDGTYEVWDPWPWWCLYALYMPAMFAVRIWERKWWSRCNVSTGKFFAV